MFIFFVDSKFILLRMYCLYEDIVFNPLKIGYFSNYFSCISNGFTIQTLWQIALETNIQICNPAHWTQGCGPEQ